MKDQKNQTRPISVRFSQQEFDAIEKRARKAGVKRHRFIRDLVRKAVGLPTVSDVVE